MATCFALTGSGYEVCCERDETNATFYMDHRGLSVSMVCLGMKILSKHCTSVLFQHVPGGCGLRDREHGGGGQRSQGEEELD